MCFDSTKHEEHADFDRWTHGFTNGNPPGYTIHTPIMVSMLDSITWEARCLCCDRAMVSNSREYSIQWLFNTECEGAPPDEDP